MAIEFAQIIGPLAESLFGEPNRAMSSATELRYGKHGSFSVDLQKGTWYDHEASEGGGALDLVTRETKLTGPARLDWLNKHGFDTTGQTNGVAQPSPRAKIVATYDYTDEGGNLLFQVCRFETPAGKDFRQRRKPRPDDNPDDIKGGWVWSIKGVRRVPYKLPELIENDDRVVFIVEGERDVDKLTAMGVPATCNPGGAGKWSAELSEYFRGCDCVIVPDRDPQKKHPKTGDPIFHPDGRPVLPGQDHAQAVALALHDVARRVRVLELWKHWKAMPLKGDVSDWVANGGTAEALYALAEDTPDHTAQKAPAVPVPLLFPFPIKGEEIPRRQWIVPGLLLRRNVTILVAPPGSGKSLLTLQMGIMMGTGMVWGGWWPRASSKTLIINAEDDNDEMRRRLYAACDEMKINKANQSLLRHNLAVAEAPGDIIVAKADGRTKTVIKQPMVDRLVQTVLDHKFDVLIVDPFAETFEGDENSNSELKWAAVLWRQIARDTNAAVMLVHHTRKFNAEAGSMDSARGGGALVGVARVVSTLFQMTEEEATLFSVKPDKRHLYVRFDDAKANLTLVTFAAKWFTKNTVKLPNGGDNEPPDEVGVLIPWEPKGIFKRINNEQINAMLDGIAKGMSIKGGELEPYTAHRRGEGNKRWAGEVIKKLVPCSGDEEPCTDEEAQHLINSWLKSGLVREIELVTSTSKGKLRKGLEVNDPQRPGVVVSEDKL